MKAKRYLITVACQQIDSRQDSLTLTHTGHNTFSGSPEAIQQFASEFAAVFTTRATRRNGPMIAPASVISVEPVKHKARRAKLISTPAKSNYGFEHTAAHYARWLANRAPAYPWRMIGKPADNVPTGHLTGDYPMSRSRRDIIDTEAMLQRLGECLAQHAIGEATMQCRADAEALRRISMTLHRWHELECGIDNGCIERDETTGNTYWLNSHTMRRYAVADRETGALKRLAAIMSRYPTLSAYVQTDPRGAALYILRPGDVPAGERAESYYSRGIAVYQ